MYLLNTRRFLSRCLRRSFGSLIDENAPINKIPGRFLRLSDKSYLDSSTLQRIDVVFDKTNGKPIQYESKQTLGSRTDIVKNVSFEDTSERYKVEWNDGHVTYLDSHWIDVQLKRRHVTGQSSKASIEGNGSINNDLCPTTSRMPWTNMTEKEIRSEAQNHKMRFDFKDLLSDDDSILQKAIKSLFQYGIIFVTSTPTSDNGSGVAALASAMSGPSNKSSPETTLMAHYLDFKKRNQNCGNERKQTNASTILERGTDGPQRTMYGNVWYTNASSMVDGTSTADSAYGNEALPLHTDFTYSRDPPGLQIFTMISPAIQGGESIFADGLAIAEYMRKNHYNEFDTLCRVRRRYRSIDKEHGWHLEGSGPVIEAIDMWEGLSRVPVNDQPMRWGPVVGIRHNDLDKLPDLPPLINSNESVEDQKQQQEYDEQFYQELDQAHDVWNRLLGSDKFRLVVGLQAGDTAVVANQRCMHGRQAFTASSETLRSVMGCYVSQDDVESRIRWVLNGNCMFK